MMDIVEELRRDRESGAKRLVCEYKAGLMSIARRFFANESDAEELVNATFAKAVANIDGYLEKSAFFAWLCQILNNEFRNSVKRKSSKNEICPGEMPEIEDETAREEIYGNLDSALLRDAIETLPPDMKKTLMMHYFMDIPVGEIAKVLSIPTGTVKWRLHNARLALAAKLGVAARKPGGKALILALALCGFAALGAAVYGIGGWKAASDVATTPTSSLDGGLETASPSGARDAGPRDWTGGTGETGGTGDGTGGTSGTGAGPASPVATSFSTPTIQQETTSMNRTTLLSAAMGAALVSGAAAPEAAAEPARPMALLIMVDGLRADAIDTAWMPNLDKLRSGEWQPGYKAAWSLDAQLAPGAKTGAGENYVSIATGVGPAKHLVTDNSKMASGNYADYPTWLARVVGADPARSAYFLSTWSNNAYIGPTNTVTTVVNASDAENAANLAALLASASAPDATMYFIEAPDIAARTSGYYPMGDSFRAALQATDGYIGQCLDAIAGRSTFADEDWLVVLTSGYGGYATYHTQVSVGRHGHTVPLVIAGRNVTAGRIPGQPCNMDAAASALAHFGVAVSGLDAVARDNTAVPEPSRPLSDGLAAYLPFDSSVTANAAAGSSVAPAAGGSVALAAGGKFGSCLDFPAGTGSRNFVKLAGSDSASLPYEGGNTCFAATIWAKHSSPAFDPPIFANKNWTGVNKGVLVYAGYSKLDNYNIGTPRGVGLNAGNGINNQTTGRIDMGPMDYEGADDWTFYAVTADETGLVTLYQGRSDGTLDWISGTLPGFTMATGCPFYIGNDATENYYNGNAERAFAGEVDDFGLWTRTLAHDEIRSVFAAGRAGIPLGSLVAAPAGPAAATWTGAVSSDPAVAGNWSGGAVPSFATAVTVSGAAAHPIAMGAALPCKSIFFYGATLGADVGEPGFDAAKIVAGSFIDLGGHVLSLRAASAYLPFSVTDTSSDASRPGILRIDDSGRNIANTTMALSGNLRFVKSGAGKFTGSATATYTGGIAVEEGTFVMGRAVSGPIAVGPGATFDQYGYSLSANPFTLAGGTLTSTKLNQGITLPSALTLTADSAIVHDDNGSNHDIGVPANAVWNLGGRALTVFIEGNDADFNIVAGSTITNGTLRFSVEKTTYNPDGKAWVGIANLNGRDGLDLDLGASYLRLKWVDGRETVNSTVHDFTCDPIPETTVFSVRLLEVYGTYTPPSTSIGFNTMLMDGATLDLSSASGAWDCTYANAGGYAGGSNTGCVLSFESGATVTVKLAGRGDLDSIAAERGLVATWAPAAVPDASTGFVLDAETAALPQGYYLRKTGDGLLLRRRDAFTLIIR